MWWIFSKVVVPSLHCYTCCYVCTVSVQISLFTDILVCADVWSFSGTDDPGIFSLAFMYVIFNHFMRFVFKKFYITAYGNSICLQVKHFVSSVCVTDTGYVGRFRVYCLFSQLSCYPAFCVFFRAAWSMTCQNYSLVSEFHCLVRFYTLFQLWYACTFHINHKVIEFFNFPNSGQFYLHVQSYEFSFQCSASMLETNFMLIATCILHFTN